MGFRLRAAAVALSFTALLFCTAPSVLGCAVADGPELLEITAAAPELIESGGELVVAGHGFPAGRSGQVELSGVRLVPGRDPQEVSVRWPARAVSSARLAVELGDAEVGALTGGAAHATFRGRLRVAFAPVNSTAPALRGHLDDVTLDALRSAPGAQPSDFANYVGIGLAPDLSIVSVVPDLEAERVGLRIGDQLHRLDGVRLLTLADFAPRANARASVLEYSRPGYAGRGEVLLARPDYFRSDESTIGLAASIGLAMLLGLLAAARPPRAAIWLTQMPARRLRSPGPRRVVSWMSAGRALLGAALVALLLRFPRGSLALDLPLLSGVSFGLLLLSAFFAGARRRPRGFSLVSGFAAACMAALALVPVLLGWALPAVSVGTLSLAELSAHQASSPLGAGLLASPWALLSASAYLLSLVPVGRETRPTTARVQSRAPLSLALEELGVGMALCIWVALHGGDIGRFDSPYAVFAFVWAELFALWTLLTWARTVSGHVSRSESWELWLRPLLLVSLAAAGVRLLLLRGDWTFVWQEQMRWLPLFCLLSLSVWMALATLRSLSHQGRRADPWL